MTTDLQPTDEVYLFFSREILNELKEIKATMPWFLSSGELFSPLTVTKLDTPCLVIASWLQKSIINADFKALVEEQPGTFTGTKIIKPRFNSELTATAFAACFYQQFVQSLSLAYNIPMTQVRTHYVMYLESVRQYVNLRINSRILQFVNDSGS